MYKSRFNLNDVIFPWFEVCITLFRPRNFLKPQMTRMTMHKLSNKKVDEIVHENLGIDNIEDRLNNLFFRNLKSFLNEIQKVIDLIKKNKNIYNSKNSTGILWLANDWVHQNLEFIYKTLKNKIVDNRFNNNLIKLKKIIIRSY